MVPDAAHKFGSGFGVTQHAWPVPPQVPHEPMAQVPKVPPQARAASTQVPLAPQQPGLVQPLSSQQGWPVAPQATHWPAAHTIAGPQLLPLGVHVALTQQPPPEQAVPWQQDCPGPPQSTHRLPKHNAAEHCAFWQHTWPSAPHAMQALPWQIVLIEQAEPASTHTPLGVQHPLAHCMPAQQI
jgi:hypothetical protein